jgi:hypothetical protein
MLFQHFSYKAHTHTHTPALKKPVDTTSRLKPAPDVMAFYRGFTGNPQEGQVWAMALGSTN